MIREDDLDDTIRKPIPKQKARKVLAHIGDWDEAVSEQWKVRANQHQTKLDDGDPFALAEVYKALCLRQEADKLSAADRRQLSLSEQCLVEELSLALGLTTERVRRSMEKAATA